MIQDFFAPRPLRVLVLHGEGHSFDAQTQDAIGRVMSEILAPGDEYDIGDAQSLTHVGDWDVAAVWAPCGSSALPAPLSEAQIPAFVVTPPLIFHPFFAAFYRDMERRGGITLPADDPETIAASLQAIRARKTLRGLRLLVVDAHENDRRAAEIAAFAVACRERCGVEILHRPASELQARAGAMGDADADRVVERWQDELLAGPGEMDVAHVRQVAKLYLAEREMLTESGAVGITVDDIGAFLVVTPRLVMPNVTYGALVRDGYLACEEADIEVLTTELLLRVGLGAHPTMSNVYLAFRDEFDALGTHEGYTAEQERADFRQCVADNHLVAAHFSTSGVLPPNMMEEERYQLRETLPAWPGQSMIASTPRLGPVVVGRLSPDASEIHLVPGQVDGRTMDDRFGWYRGRWFIRIASVSNFITHCQHQHYAIGPENGATKTLQILTERLQRLRLVEPLLEHGF